MKIDFDYEDTGFIALGEVKIATLEMAISALLAVEAVDKKERKE